MRGYLHGSKKKQRRATHLENAARDLREAELKERRKAARVHTHKSPIQVSLATGNPLVNPGHYVMLEQYTRQDGPAVMPEPTCVATPPSSDELTNPTATKPDARGRRYVSWWKDARKQRERNERKRQQHRKRQRAA